jgi:hypothetical protein
MTHPLISLILATLLALFLLWNDISKIHRLMPNETLFGDNVFNEVIKVK